MHARVAVVAALMWCSCGSMRADDAGSPDASLADASVEDAGSTDDAGIADDGGAPDAGEPVDAGPAFRLEAIGLSRPTLIADLGQHTQATFRLVDRAAVPQPGVSVTVSVSLGLISPSGAPSATFVTDSAGEITAEVIDSGLAAGSRITITAYALDATAVASVRVIDVARIASKLDASTLRTLSASSVDAGTSSTPVFFAVTDSTDQPVSGVAVRFELQLVFAGGTTLEPLTATSDAMGVVKTVLSAGDVRGFAQVHARVVDTPLAASIDFTITRGWPSDEYLFTRCDRSTLGAFIPNEGSLPRFDLSMTCRLSVADRFGVPITQNTPVFWLSEAGVMSSPTTLLRDSGSTTSTFTTSLTLPVPTTPLPGEPSLGTANPRDGLVTIIGAVRGEERFYDGSNGSPPNARYDPGEVFIDLPEPFADANDNDTYDPGEFFFDVEHIDCTTGQRLAPNGQWDGPNGCWDVDTMVWQSTHVMYGGVLVDQPSSDFFTFTPALPIVVEPGQQVTLEVAWFDANFNVLSADQPRLAINRLSGTAGSVQFSATAGPDPLGHHLSDVLVDAQNAPCNPMQPSTPPQCVRRVLFDGWATSPTGGRLVIIGRRGDAGVPGVSDFELTGRNALQTGSSTKPFQIQFN